MYYEAPADIGNAFSVTGADGNPNKVRRFHQREEFFQLVDPESKAWTGNFSFTRDK